MMQAIKKRIAIHAPTLWIIGMSLLLIACTESSSLVSDEKTATGTRTVENGTSETKEDSVTVHDSNPVVGAKEELSTEPANITGIFLVKCGTTVVSELTATVQCQVVGDNGLQPDDSAVFVWDYTHPAKDQVAGQVQCSSKGATAVYTLQAASMEELSQLLTQTKPVVTSNLANSQIIGTAFNNPLAAANPSPTASPTPSSSAALPPGISSFGSTRVSPTELNITWKAAGPVAGFLLVAHAASAVTFSAVNGISYTTGAQGADQIIYVGPNTSFSHKGLQANVHYNYRLYTFDGAYTYSSPLIGGGG
jgi:hypothetical protein